MKRKRLTQLFPWLLPLRVKQRKLFFYGRMRFDKNRYATAISANPLPHRFFSADFALYNADTGFDMVYQHNKVYNMKIAAEALNGLLIKPGETFSFWNSVRRADRHTPYKDGLIVINGELTTERGGGLCLISNLLFWLFLHTPLTVTERRTHMVKDFPTAPNTGPDGVDATIREGWLDLKVRNDTDAAFQIKFDFYRDHVTGKILSDKAAERDYVITSGTPRYYRKSGKIYEQVSVYRDDTLLYENLCQVGYSLPVGTPIDERSD